MEKMIKDAILTCARHLQVKLANNGKSIAALNTVNNYLNKTENGQKWTKTGLVFDGLLINCEPYLQGH